MQALLPCLQHLRVIANLWFPGAVDAFGGNSNLIDSVRPPVRRVSGSCPPRYSAGHLDVSSKLLPGSNLGCKGSLARPLAFQASRHNHSSPREVPDARPGELSLKGKGSGPCTPSQPRRNDRLGCDSELRIRCVPIKLLPTLCVLLVVCCF